MKSLVIVQGIARVFSVLTLIGFICSVVGAAGAAVGGLLLAVLPLAFGEQILPYLTDAGVESVSGLACTCFAAAAVAAGAAVALFFVRGYFKHELAAGTPFTQDGAKELRYVGILCMVLPFVTAVLGGIILAFGGVSDTVKIEGHIGGGLTMLLLSYLLSYGADLAEKTEKTDG